MHAAAARATADWVDALRKTCAALPAWAGIPISIQDCFDEGGGVTTAGSAVMADAPPAARDAVAVARLRAAGFIAIGRSNMSEFAYSGIGLNAQHGTPACAWDRAHRRIPGGSSSGAAISIADSMAHAALGSDSGGSCRIPSALNGLVGFKPTARRVPLDGANSMVPSLDSIGPLAVSAGCAVSLDAVLAGDADNTRPPPRRLRLGLAQPTTVEGLDPPVAAAFEAALTTLSRNGTIIEDVALPELGELPTINAKGGFAAAEYYAWHRSLIAERADLYDPRILQLILRGREQSAADYLDLLRLRRSLIERVGAKTAGLDALVMPTVPIVAPPIAEMEDPAEYTRVNLALLRNTRLANFLDGCAISLPCHRPGEMPVGLLLQGGRGWDAKILGIAAAVEAVLARQD